MECILFLDKLADLLLDHFEEQFLSVTIVLPNKRAKVFLLESIKNKTTKTIFAPKIISIEDLIQDISEIRSLDAISVLFEFYAVYCEITEKKHQQSFEVFSNWAKILLQDFNEIDRYLLNPAHVLSYLKDIEDIKKWGVSVENKTQLLENYIDFWKQLPIYYESLYNYFLRQKTGYQGLIYREAVKKIGNFSENIGNNQYIFAGFNALNAAEEKLVQYLLEKKQAHIYWDVDTSFLNDPFHDAGLFVRRFKQSWKHYKTHPFEWIFSDFSQPKNIQIIGTPKNIGQAKIAGSIIEKLVENTKNIILNKVALILGEENILIPLLYSLPKSVGPLNITMGYSSKNNPVQLLVYKLFKMHTRALSKKEGGYVLYYKEVLEILTHPLIGIYIDGDDLVKIINKNNYTFISHQKIMDFNKNSNELFLLLFQKWEESALTVLDRILKILLILKSCLNNDIEEDKITKAFVFSVYKVVNQLNNYFLKYNYLNKIETLFAIYKQIIEFAEVSFEGEPLQGLQIMGVLESRVLDFDTVIITGMNEGKLPAGKSQNTFIPYDVKRELGLPTFKEKDAIYTYHFYHLLQRAKNIYLIYNTESEGLDAGEKSRFITQLEVEKQPNHNITHKIYNANVPEMAYKPMQIQKTDLVMNRLREIAEKGFSPSALITYIRNPMQFYFQQITRIRDPEIVEENIALKTLGTIIHETLKVLYKPFLGQFISEKDIEKCLKEIDKIVLQQFKLIYKDGEIKKGRNLLAFEVAKRNVLNFLKYELELLKKGDTVKIIALEANFERILKDKRLPFPVLIAGNVDRIEERNGIVRILDYKTGRVDLKDVTLKSWEGLTLNPKNDKIIQLLSYWFMFENKAQNKVIEAGIISFKNLKSGFLPFSFKENFFGVKLLPNEKIPGDEIMNFYKEELVILLKEILDKNIPFIEVV